MYIVLVESWCGIGIAPEEETENGLPCPVNVGIITKFQMALVWVCRRKLPRVYLYSFYVMCGKESLKQNCKSSASSLHRDNLYHTKNTFSPLQRPIY